MIKFFRREGNFRIAQFGISNIPPCKRGREDTTSQLSAGVSMEGARTRGPGSTGEVNEADNRE